MGKTVIYEDQPKHFLAVDCVTFGYEDGELNLLLFRRQLNPEKGKWSLVGGWVEINEAVEKVAERVLAKFTGLRDIFQEQVEVFSDSDRDSGGRVVSVAFYALIDIKSHNKELLHQYGVSWWPLSKTPQLIFDHQQMVASALKTLRSKASYELVGRGLLPSEFTITQLRLLYSSIFMQKFDPGNFRKKIFRLTPSNALIKRTPVTLRKELFLPV